MADAMEARGWKMERQQNPNCLHCTMTVPHSKRIEHWKRDLAASVDEVKQHPDMATKGTAAAYGMVASIPDGAVVDDFLLTFLKKTYRV